jgi:peptidyl-tRNA hydrolase
VTVFHDELDLAPQVSGQAEAAAGHNGWSIHQHLGTDAYGRVRLGIGHLHKDAVADTFCMTSARRIRLAGRSGCALDGAGALAAGMGRNS